MRLKELLKMKGNVLHHVGPQQTLPGALAQMVEKDIGSLLVMDGDRMVGLITFRELLAAIHHHENGMQSVRIADIMITDPATAGPDDTIDHMRALMTEKHIRYLPIIDNGELLGVLSFHDLARAALNVATIENRVLKRYIKNWPEDDAA